jgi:hypothetical protein
MKNKIVTKQMTKRKKDKINYISDNTSAQTIVKNIIIVFLLFAFAYGLTIILSRYGVFEKGYTPLETNNSFSDEYILIGTILNRNESEYYVAFDDFSSNNANAYFSGLISNTSVKTKIYKVDMTLSFNSNYKSETSNPKAKSVDALKINGATLIKVNNKSIVEYTEGTEAISKILVK